MVKLSILNLDKKEVGFVELPDEVFDMELNESVISAVVSQQLARKRAGSACTKERSFVSGGGRKPWRQKGTGRARVGSIRSPLWRGGGIIFGPKPRKYGSLPPKKIRKASLKIALSQKRREDKILVLDQLQIAEPKTKLMNQLLINLGIERSCLIVLAQKDEIIKRASNNIPWVKFLTVDGLNVYDILKFDTLLTTEDGLKSIQERLQ